MPKGSTIPVYFHREQLEFRPRYEWVGGARTEHPEKIGLNVRAVLEGIAAGLRKTSG